MSDPLLTPLDQATLHRYYEDAIDDIDEARKRQCERFGMKYDPETMSLRRLLEIPE